MKKIICLVISLIMICGCVTLQSGSVKQKMSKIDYSDGINKEEAIVIAQDHILKERIPVYSLTPNGVRQEVVMFYSNKNAAMYVADKQYQDKEVTVWVVTFSCKSSQFMFLPLPHLVFIDVKKGNVIYEYTDVM